MAEIKTFPINTISDFASTTEHGLSRQLYYSSADHGIPSKIGLTELKDYTPSQRAVTYAISNLITRDIHTTHPANGSLIDANTVIDSLTQSVAANTSNKYILKNKSIISAQNIDNASPNTFQVKTTDGQDGQVWVYASNSLNSSILEMWEGDDANKLYQQVQNIVEVFNFDNITSKKTVRYGARKYTPMKCYYDIGSTAGNDYTAIMNNDLALDINYISGERMKIINKALPLFEIFGDGSFTLSIKFVAGLPISSEVSMIPLFSCMNDSNTIGISATFNKINMNKWKLIVTINSTLGTYTFTSADANIFDSKKHTLTLSVLKNDAAIAISSYLNSDIGTYSKDGVLEKMTASSNNSATSITDKTITHNSVILWSIQTTVSSNGFLLCGGSNYSGMIDDLYFFNVGFDVSTIELLHNARFIGPQETRLLKSVQGGIYQKTAMVSVSSLYNSGCQGVDLFKIKPGEIIGKIFIKAMPPGITMKGQRYSIGMDVSGYPNRTDKREHFVKNIDFYYEESQTGLLETWSYGVLFQNNEMYYVTEEDTVKLYMTDRDPEYGSANDITGNLAITMFYDVANWTPKQFYTMGHLNESAIYNNVMCLNLNSETLEYSSRCVGITNSTDYGIAEWRKYIFCAGGLSTVVSSEYTTDISSLNLIKVSSAISDYMSFIQKYDTANDYISPVVRCQLSSERRNAGKIGLVKYSMCSGFDRIYFIGGCVNHGLKNENGVYETDYYETLRTVDKFNPNIDTINAIANAKLNYPRTGSTVYTHNDSTIYILNGIITTGGNIPRYSDSYYYNNANKTEKIILATDTACVLSAYDSVGIDGMSKMKMISENGKMYLAGGISYSDSDGQYGQSVSTCVEFSPTESISTSWTANAVYSVSGACCGQDQIYGWLIGGEQRNKSVKDDIPWTSKFEFATKTFSVANIVMPKTVSSDNGLSL